MKRLHVLGICALVAVSLIVAAPVPSLNRKVSDLFFTSSTTTSPITIIAIDDASIAPDSRLGRFRDWPRTYYAQALREINKYNPAVVGIDLDFRDVTRGISDQRLNQIIQLQSQNPGSSVDWNSVVGLFIQNQTGTLKIQHPDDVEFQKALGETKRVVLTEPLLVSASGVPDKNILPTVSGSLPPVFSGTTIKTGFNNGFFDSDGVVRRTIQTLGGKNNFARVLAEEYASAIGGTLNTTAFPADTYNRIRFLGMPGKSFNIVSFADLLGGRVDPQLIANRIVLIGPTAGSLQDAAPTLTGATPMPGVEILGSIAQQIIDGAVVIESGVIWKVVASIAAILIAFLFLVFSLRYFAVLFSLLFIGLPVVSFVVYQQGIVLDVIHPFLVLIIMGIIVLLYRNQTELKAKKAIREAFAHYVSPVVVNELVKDPGKLSLGGKRQTITVLFSDIVGFTTLSEKLTPEDTVALLNDYLTAMTDVIFEFGGTLDKYQGDAIMALFGAPLEDKNHSANAVHAALRMRQALVALHDKWSSIGNLPFKDELTQLDFRVGITTGPAVIGNVGSQKRFDYTAIGDIVNLGSRLEAINRKYGTRVIVDKGTFAAITENSNPFACRKLDVVRVKGKAIETEIFEVVGQSDTFSADMKTMLDDFENARVLYTERNFIGAKEAFRAILDRFPEDGPSIIYKNRCEFFLRKPPNIDWSPIVNLDEK